MKEELKAEFTKMLPGGVLDDSTYEQIEDALDRAEAPCTSVTGGWLLLSERITLFAAIQKKEMEALRARLALLESVLAEAGEALEPLVRAAEFIEMRDRAGILLTDPLLRQISHADANRAATVSAKIVAMDAALKDRANV